MICVTIDVMFTKSKITEYTPHSSNPCIDTNYIQQKFAPCLVSLFNPYTVAQNIEATLHTKVKFSGNQHSFLRYNNRFRD